MAAELGSIHSPALQRLATRARAAAAQVAERCEICAAEIPSAHRHLLEVDAREVRCVCVPCSILFDREAASMGRRRLIPDRCLRLEPFDMSDSEWETLNVPVGTAYFFCSTPAGRVLASYPGPAGGVESLPPVASWEELAAQNPVLASMQADVEALLVHRTQTTREQYLVPIDACFRLSAIIRRHWRGLSGGRQVWDEVDGYFAGLRGRATVAAGGPANEMDGGCGHDPRRLPSPPERPELAECGPR